MCIRDSPNREKKVDHLKDVAAALIKNTGHEEISLSSLSSVSYTHLDVYKRQMENQLLHTPDGVRDIYNGECKKKLYLQDKRCV